MTACVKRVEPEDDTLVDKLIALGVVSILDLEDIGEEPLVSELGMENALAEKLVAAASEDSKKLAAETKKKQAEDLLEKEQQEKRESEPSDDRQAAQA